MLNRFKKTVALFVTFMAAVAILSSCSRSENTPALSLDDQRRQVEEAARYRVLDSVEGVNTQNEATPAGEEIPVYIDIPSVANTAVSDALKAFTTSEANRFRQELASAGAANDVSGLYHFTLTYQPF